jgi:hypothetical protein
LTPSRLCAVYGGCGVCADYSCWVVDKEIRGRGGALARVPAAGQLRREYGALLSCYAVEQ